MLLQDSKGMGLLEYVIVLALIGLVIYSYSDLVGPASLDFYNDASNGLAQPLPSPFWESP